MNEETSIMNEDIYVMNEKIGEIGNCYSVKKDIIAKIVGKNSSIISHY
ncbi:MAG: hypothetical protein HGB12_04185 [Bacteroidetes bacterium]|nr:hypothetical protein [Bacteroidota bacterium]